MLQRPARREHGRGTAGPVPLSLPTCVSCYLAPREPYHPEPSAAQRSVHSFRGAPVVGFRVKDEESIGGEGGQTGLRGMETSNRPK